MCPFCSQVVYNSAERESASQAGRQAVFPERGQVADTIGVCAVAFVSILPARSNAKAATEQYVDAWVQLRASTTVH